MEVGHKEETPTVHWSVSGALITLLQMGLDLNLISLMG